MDVGVRELRNHTADVIAAVEAGEIVYLTSHRRRIAVITPVNGVEGDLLRALMERIDRTPAFDSGLAKAVEASRALYQTQEREPWS